MYRPAGTFQFYSCPATMGNDWESSRHGNPDRGRVESSPWAYGQERWSRFFEQNFRVDKWNLCRD